MNTTDKSLYEITGDIKDINTLLVGRTEIEALARDAERYRFIRDADRSGCISYEIRTYAMETLDEYVDAAIEGESAMQEKQS